MYRYFLALGFLLVLSACQSDKPKTSETEKTVDLKEALAGVWETVSVRVDINSAGNTEDSTAVFEVNESNWEKNLGIKPIRTYYETDNKYRSIYKAAAKDTILNEIRGMWNTFGDTLILIEPTVTYTYEVTILENGTSIYRSFLDWDGDGNFDDLYVGKQRLVSRSTLE